LLGGKLEIRRAYNTAPHEFCILTQVAELNDLGPARKLGGEPGSTCRQQQKVL
jgi:hypothetical protein